MAGPESTWKASDQAVAQVPGDGSYGNRRGYLWMLCGNDGLIKPDRLVLRRLSRFEPGIDPDRARQVVDKVAVVLTARLRRPVTPWMVDHTIWLDERTR
ncbi:hypothetical protein GCM10029963_33160 [Micromonospora andamanensis]|uniref:hypothetical protein n=1 Tax=Micromonospora andamanensis TaxID=1287068 RepID=UPI00194F35C7|nr:hypothetical protein [Micromonospora andamanensis]GIJ42030.1 hypothetical protein Vwe01_53550 [Micromonospora andamanensis]